VFRRHPVLAQIARKLRGLGACPARMTGSGSAIFGLFEAAGTRDDAVRALSARYGSEAGVFRIAFVSRARYQSAWRRMLKAHATEQSAWPPLTRYSKQ
jgi:4-diphosphocytidyl-2C-methyl-D-erythritol kinase